MIGGGHLKDCAGPWFKGIADTDRIRMVSKKIENQTVPKQCNFKSSIKKGIQEPRGTIDQVHAKMLVEFRENDRLGVHVRVLEHEAAEGPPLAAGISEAGPYHAALRKMVDQHAKGEKDMVEYLLNLGLFLREVEDTHLDQAGPPPPPHTLMYGDSPVQKPTPVPVMEDRRHQHWMGLDVTTTEEDNKGFRYRKYISNVCKGEAQAEACNNELVCNRCGGNKLADVTNASLVCPDCGDSSTYIDCTGLHYNMWSDTTISCVHMYEYKRINHLNDWMASFQGAENVVISNDIIELVDNEIRKQRLDRIGLKPADIKVILKKLKLNKFYEHTAGILYRVTGIKPVSLPEETQERIRRMFLQAEATFKKMPAEARGGRSNFLSYSYLIHKFVRLVGRPDLQDYFPLLKSRQKLWAQDKVWKQICEANRWEFYPSM